MKKPIADITEQEYDKIFAINAKAPFFVMQEAFKVMEDNGRIVNLGTSLLAVTTGCTYIENAKTALKAETNIYIRLFCLCRKQSSLTCFRDYCLQESCTPTRTSSYPIL